MQRAGAQRGGPAPAGTPGEESGRREAQAAPVHVTNYTAEPPLDRCPDDPSSELGGALEFKAVASTRLTGSYQDLSCAF